MPFTAILLGASAVGGALANRSKTVTQLPIEDPLYAPLLAGLRQKALERLNTGLPAGYVPQGLSTINANTNSAERALSNRLTGLGLSGSPVQGAGLTDLYTKRTAQQNELQNVTAPLLEQQINTDNIRNATGVAGLQKTGTSSTDPGNPLAGGLNGLATSLGLLMGQNLLGNSGGVSRNSTSNFPQLPIPSGGTSPLPAASNSSLDPNTAALFQGLLAQLSALPKAPGTVGYLPSLPTLGG